MTDRDPDSRTVLVAGTASHVGKSTVVAGLCRLLARQGVDAAPFKAQNMSNNAWAVPRAPGADDGGRGQPPDGDQAEFGEVGVSQYVQARAAETTATTDCNPVLLKPRGEGESQLLIDGRPVGHFEAGTYYEEHWDRARQAAREAHRRLARDHEVIVAEGAGSIAEINLQDRDLANVETARFADAEILLVADVERGGVFASLYGTLELMPDDLRERVCGVVINKFRGDRSLLDPGIEELEEMTGVPVLGVLPHEDPGLPAEDSVSLPPEGERAVRGDDDGVEDGRAVTVGAIRLPRISNFTDLEPLARVPGVRVAYLPLGTTLADVDAVVLPGTKNTVDDLLALKRAGLDDRLRAFEGPVVGICGGYQMLGQRIAGAEIEGTGAHVEETGDRSTVEGIGLLPVETRFSPEKTIEPTTVEVNGAGPIAGADGTARGYEIHMGDTVVEEEVPRPLGADSAVRGSVLGTYLHGLFENRGVRRAFVEAVAASAGVEPPGTDPGERSPHDAAADLVAGLALASVFPDGPEVDGRTK